jgi:glycosyltransferase involved in cell wall biosynthesis
MLVSAIMPTAGRRHLIPVALASFAAQDWPEKELIVVDDGEIPVSDLICDVADVYYVRLVGKQTIGAKRNTACEYARGEVIVHFDDDDWSAPGRIRDQVERLQQTEKALTGYNHLLFWDGARAYRYTNDDPTYTTGTSMCYRKDLWKKHAFQNISRAEDNRFWELAKNAGKSVAVDAKQLMVARIHDANTFNYRSLNGETFPQVQVTEIPPSFLNAIAS